MNRSTFLILAATVPFILTCINPDDPFSDKGNALGTVELFSDSGLNTDSLYYDSTGNPIRIKATFFLPEYIDSGILTMRYYRDTVYDTIAKAAFDKNIVADHDTLDTFGGSGDIVNVSLYAAGWIGGTRFRNELLTDSCVR